MFLGMEIEQSMLWFVVGEHHACQLTYKGEIKQINARIGKLHALIWEKKKKPNKDADTHALEQEIRALERRINTLRYFLQLGITCACRL